MKIVLDNNIFFSLMKADSAASYIFSSFNIELLAPEFIKSEFNKYKEDCLFKSGLSEHEFEIRQIEIESNIKFFKLSEYENFIKESLKVLSDRDDADFLALALKLNCSIWSNDSHFKQQSLVKVFTTAEFIDKLLKEEV